MKPADYDINLADSIYSEIAFIIDINQFDEDAQSLPSDMVDVWMHELADAKEAGQQIANLTGVEVLVDVYGRWGGYGKMLEETLTIKPERGVQ